MCLYTIKNQIGLPALLKWVDIECSDYLLELLYVCSKLSVLFGSFGFHLIQGEIDCFFLSIVVSFIYLGDNI